MARFPDPCHSALLLAVLLLPIQPVAAGSHDSAGFNARAIAERVDALNARFRETRETKYIDEVDQLLDPLTDAQRDAVDEAYDDLLSKQLREKERFERELASLRGDEWAAYTAAFFSSTLFEVDKPFEQALGENLYALGQQTDQTVQQLVENMNAQVRAEQETAAAAAEAERQAKLREVGKQVLASYDQVTDEVVIDTGFLDYARSTSVNRSALMVQDGFTGNTLQIRYQLNLLKNATGEVPEGNFANQPGYEVFNITSGTLRDIGHLQQQGADDSVIEAKTDGLTDFLALRGQQPTPEHLAARAGYIDLLTPLAEDTASKYALFQRIDSTLRIRKLDRNLLLPPRSRDPEEIAAFEAKRDALDKEIADLQAQLDGMTPEQAEFDYQMTLNQSPFLSAPIDVEGFEGPLWQYLAGPIGGYNPTYDTSHRTPEKDQQALDQAIDYLDGLTMNVLVEYGSIVESEPLIRFAGGPAAAGIRQNLTQQFAETIPGMGAYMGELEGLFEREWTETEYERRLVDAGTGLAAVAVGGTIVLLPVTAPVLVPVEIGLMGTQLGIEGGRLVIAYQQASQVETLAQSGSGDFTALTRYDDVLHAQTFTFVLTVALTPLGVKGSVGALDDAARLVSQGEKAAAAAGGAGRSADDVIRSGDSLAGAADDAVDFLDDTRIIRAGSVDAPRPGNVPDIDTLRNMTPEDQAAALAGLPDELQGRLVSQLSPADQQALSTAKVYHEIVQGIRRRPDVIGVRVGNELTELTAERVAQMTDDEIRVAVRNGEFVLDRGGMRELMDEVGDELVGPFSRIPGQNEAFGEAGGDLPVPGFYSGTNLTQDEVDDLFRIDVDSLPVDERQAVLLRKADALRQGFRPSFGADPETRRALVETMVIHLQRKMGRNLRLDELDRVGWDLDWGRPPGWGPPKGWADNVPAGISEGNSTVMGAGDTGGSTVTGGAAPARPPLLTMDQILGNRPFFRDLAETPAYEQSFLPSFYDIGLRMHGPNPGNALDRILVELDQTVGTGTVLAPRPSAGSGQIFSEGSAIIQLRPGAWTIPESKGALWRNFLFRFFMIGACQGDWTSQCENETPIGVLAVPADQEDEVAASLSQDPQVAMVEANAGRVRQAVDDPLFLARGSWGQDYPDQWALKRVGLTGEDAAWPVVAGSSDPVVVAVIDTGLAWSHPDFSLGNLWLNPGEIPANDIDDDWNGYVDDVAGWNFLDHKPVAWDLDGHGTLVASIIAAQTGNGIGIAGVNPTVRIMPLKAVNNAGQSRASFVAEAVVYAVNNGARIINLSVGGERLTRTEQLAIDYAASRGVLVIAAAGNEGIQLADYGPAGAEHVLTVAATGPDDRRLMSSNWGSQVDLAAPGVDVVGLRAPATDLMRTAGVADYRPEDNFVGADQLYYRATGTSFAAPIVAGVASLLLAANPALTSDQLERMLLNSALDIEAPGVDQFTGYGRLDARGALAASPDYFLLATVTGVGITQVDGAPMIEVVGTADANRMQRAWLELGAGENPGDWRPVGRPIAAPVRDGVLQRFVVQELAGQPQWTLRLVVEHEDGSRREARYLLNTG
jgi:subtilisin family serine protease